MNGVLTWLTNFFIPKSLDDTLVERGKIYGGYREHARMVKSILNSQRVMSNNVTNFYLVSKLVRWVADTSHIDSLVDMAGYAKLELETNDHPIMVEPKDEAQFREAVQNEIGLLIEYGVNRPNSLVKDDEMIVIKLVWNVMGYLDNGNPEFLKKIIGISNGRF